jgi:hypothetical protein
MEAELTQKNSLETLEFIQAREEEEEEEEEIKN